MRNLAFNERRRQGRRSAPQPLEQPPAGAGVGGLDALVHAEQLLIWEGNEKTSGEGPKRVESVWIQTTDAP